MWWYKILVVCKMEGMTVNQSTIKKSLGNITLGYIDIDCRRFLKKRKIMAYGPNCSNIAHL